MYQPFITLWVGEQYTFEYPIVVLFCIYFYLVIMQQVIGLYKDAAGIWHQDRFRPLIASLVNLALNIVLVGKWGIYAIVASTLISYLAVAIPWMISNVFTYVFKRSAKEYIFITLKNVVACTAVTAITIMVCGFVHTDKLFVRLVINSIICCLLPNVLLWCIYKNNENYYQMLNYIGRLMPGRIQRIFLNILKR